jgi:hypothetical protein
MNGGLLRRRLGQYGAAWFLSFLAVLLIGFLGPLLFHASLTALADVVLPIVLAVLGLLLVAFFVSLVFAREGLGSKIVLFVLGLILTLPLLWAPVLAVVADAAMLKVSVEYSNAYAGFRIIIGRLLFPLAQTATSGGDVLAALWSGFEVVATIIGFIAAVSQLWPAVRRMLGGAAVEV